MYRLLTAVALFSLLTACNNTDTTTAETVEETTVAAPTYAGEIFGEGETDQFQEALSYAELVAEMESLGEADTLETQVHGIVEAVCQAKGCWMTIGEVGEMMVRFKDYGFFMPKDISGREVIAEGKAYYQTTSVDELRHYAEDAGESAEAIAAITEPKRELRFLASGVLLLAEEAAPESH
ncbi:MAG: DUF4920 domain-containing protein [Bacteroidota bacterium]